MNRVTAGASGMSLHCRWGSELTWEWLEGGVRGLLLSRSSCLAVVLMPSETAKLQAWELTLLPYPGRATMGRICDEIDLAVKLDRFLPHFVLSHPSSHRHGSPATLDGISKPPRSADWGLARAPQPSAHPAKLFVAFGKFNGLISIFRLGNAVRWHQGCSGC